MGASIEGTQGYFQKRPAPQSFRVLGKTGWTVSRVGFGCYRIWDGEESHDHALTQALLSGCNLVDTSTNYADGESEKLVGNVLARLFGEGKLRRDEVVVVTKVGYVQGLNMERAQERRDKGRSFPEMVEYSPDCWHCISPEFLEEQISLSMKRLRLSQIDVLLLHNPEYYLKSGGDFAAYYGRIGKAFEYLETEVRRGRIQYYGISSNSFPDPKESAEYTSLETVLETAHKTASENHFAVIQFPFNLYESGAVLEKNNSGLTLLQRARNEQLGTLINRPLNAFVENRLIRLADFPAHEGQNTEDILREQFKKVIEMETGAEVKPIIPKLQTPWGHVLKSNLDQLGDLGTFKQVLHHQIQPSMQQSLEKLRQGHEFADWAVQYKTACEKLFLAYIAFLESQLSRESDTLSCLLDQACPELASSKTLSQKVLKIYQSLEGIDCVLVGMREERYVKDALTTQDRLEPSQALNILVDIHEEIENLR